MTNAQRKPIVLPNDEEEAKIQAGIALDPENPELTDEEIARLRPARDVLSSALYAALTGENQNPVEKPVFTKKRIKLREEAIKRDPKTGKILRQRIKRRRLGRAAANRVEKQLA